MDYENLLRQYRKSQITTLQQLEKKPGFVKLDYTQEEIKKIIPHREPFLLIDRIIGVDLTKGQETIIGSRLISRSDPVFQGHFPDYPIYPGSLQLEMSGQLGLCLTYFVIHDKTAIDKNTKAVSVRATKIYGALFLEPVFPDREVILISQKLEYNGYFGTVLSQVISDHKVCCASVAEVIFLDT
ncbi:MAG: beta-hydroxyacyl-ACP dehydratase [Candidatus Aminicenantes bacterium]|nr:beta-hydroxyacyl-ACP dehydratase [Candidatus Aminicenantes bacterium]MDH5466610.1 beta-hydroxyacyl-ACP dehydratase [Candidatus Aminicenantes bacterium]MDH5704902.1 beta-hydroxyacyl-ACP dehydratase [Candidatus Aminicenantes bacterium]